MTKPPFLVTEEGPDRATCPPTRIEAAFPAKSSFWTLTDGHPRNYTCRLRLAFAGRHMAPRCIQALLPPLDSDEHKAQCFIRR